MEGKSSGSGFSVEGLESPKIDRPKMLQAFFEKPKTSAEAPETKSTTSCMKRLREMPCNSHSRMLCLGCNTLVKGISVLGA